MDTSQALRPERYETYLMVISRMTSYFSRMWSRARRAPEVFAAYRVLFGELICKERREYYGDISREILHGCQTMLRGFWGGQAPHREPPAGHLDQLIHGWFEMVLGIIEIDGHGVADVVQELMERSDREYVLWHWDGESPWLYMRLVGVKGGPRPEDWKFWWSQPTDGLVGEFWSLVEREQEETGFLEEEPLCAIPGTWVE